MTSCLSIKLVVFLGLKYFLLMLVDSNNNNICLPHTVRDLTSVRL